MKQEDLDELRNIYLGLVTGGEGPEVLSEAPTSGVYEAKKKLDLVGQEDDDIDNDGDTDKSDKYLLNRRKVRSKAIDEGIGSAIRGLFGKKKEPEAPKPLSRGAELRQKYGTETSPKQQILAKTRARAEEDEKEYGDSPYSKSVATNSREAHNTRLRAGYSLHRATGGSGGEGGSGGPGRGSKAAKRAAALKLNNSYDLYDLIQSHLLEYGFADTEEGANMIIENMSPSWIKQILSED